MAHSADPLNSTPLNPNAGDQNDSSDVPREVLDQLASTFRPSWELDAATFSGPSELSSNEIQALQAGGGTAPELRGEAHASIGPLAPPKPTELSEPTESIIVQGTPAPESAVAAADSPFATASAAAAVHAPILSAGVPPELAEDTVADMPSPLLHGVANAPYPASPLHQRSTGPLLIPPDEPPPPRAPSFLPPAPAAEAPVGRTSVRPAAPTAEAPVRMPSTRPPAWGVETPLAARRPSRPPLASLDFDVPPFARRSKTPLWIAVGLAAAGLISAAFWSFGGSPAPAPSTASAPATVEAPPPPPAKPPPRIEPTAEAPAVPQPNPLAAPPPALPTAAAAEPPPAPPPTPTAYAPAPISPPPVPAAVRPVQHPTAAAAPKPAVHPKAGNPTIVRDVPF